MMTGMGYLVITYVKTIDAARVMLNNMPDVGGDTFKGARVVGVFRMPTRDEIVCAGASRCKEVGWKRLHPEGHMVHACGHRNAHYRDQLAGHAGGLLDTYGINLLPRDRTPVVFRNPEGWDRPSGKRRGVVDL